VFLLALKTWLVLLESALVSAVASHVACFTTSVSGLGQCIATWAPAALLMPADVSLSIVVWFGLFGLCFLYP
jgi:hypothetical protein